MPQPQRVLVIPSWYPTTVNPMVGTFFQEQGALLQHRYDVRVLFGISRHVSYKSAVIRYHWFPKRGLARVRPTPIDTYSDQPPVITFEYFHRSTNESANWDASADAYRKMFVHLLSEGWYPDLIHAHCAESAGIITAKLASEFSLPWVLTEHQVFALANYPAQRRRLMVDALNGATQLVAVSQHQLRCIFIHNITRPITVMGNLVDENVFRYAELQRDATCFRVLTVTYPYPIKDCDTFFRSIALVVRRGHTNIKVTVIGNDSFHDLSIANTDEFRRLAIKYGIEHVCRFITYARRSEMPKYYAECDVFVSTSVAETFGVAMREAMAVGRPVICTASGGVEDDLSPVNGVKVDIHNHEGIADALIAIKTGHLRFDPQTVRNSVVARHGRQAFLNQIAAVYARAMANNNQQRLYA